VISAKINQLESQLDGGQDDALLRPLVPLLALDLVDAFELVPDLPLETDPSVVVPGVLDDLGASLDHQDVPADLLLTAAVALDVVESGLQHLDQGGQAAFAGVAVFVAQGRTVLHAG